MLAWAVYRLRSDGLWQGALWFLILALWVMGHYVASPKRRYSRFEAYAMNWVLPAITLGATVYRGLAKDYWGVAFWSIGLGFAVVNAVYLEPSPRRTMLVRLLIGLLVVVSAAAIWKTVWP